jgi:glyoxylase-like metal-dependent hydrolase (beta-lactamase superfamily II)
MLPGAHELAPGLWRWKAYHDDWKHDVACLAYDTGSGLVLVDPLAPPQLREARRFWKALDAVARDRPGGVDVVVTLHYHRRSAAAVAHRYRGRVWAPAASVDRLGIHVDHAFTAGAMLPGEIHAYASGRDDEVVLWLPGPRAIVAGDVLLGGVRKPLRVCPASWLPRSVTRSDVARALSPLRALPVELVVPLHGAPIVDGARAALAAALDEADQAVSAS